MKNDDLLKVPGVTLEEISDGTTTPPPVKKLSYFNIKEAFYALFNELEENDGELTEEIQVEFASLELSLEDKMHSLFYIKKEKEAAKAMLSDEIKRLTVKVKSLDKVIERVKAMALDATIEFGKTGKTGNKSLKYEDLSIYTVNKETLIEPDDSKSFMDMAKYLLEADLFEDGDEIEAELFEFSCALKKMSLKKAKLLQNLFPIETIIPSVNKDEMEKRIKSNKELTKQGSLFADTKETYNYDVVEKPYIVMK